jgi:hypothetical protein
VRETLEADRPSTAQADTRATPSTSSTSAFARTPRALAALQRLAGNAAVAQRILVIENRGRHFDKTAGATEYLEKKFAKRYGKPLTTAQAARLQELAESAKDRNEVYAVPTLDAALAYIAHSTPINAPRQSYDPSASPARGPQPEWGYSMAGRAPAAIEAPQSPQYAFPTTAHSPVEIDVPEMLGQQRDAITEKRAKATRKLGKNLFHYGVRAEVRVTPLGVSQDATGSEVYGPSGPSQAASADAGSNLYQSKFDLPKPGKRERKETSMRDELQVIHDKFKSHPTLKKTAMYSSDRSGDYFKKAKSGAISTMFVHSEVQAAAEAHDHTAKELVARLIAAIEQAARAEQAAPGAPIEVVVAAVNMMGFSAPNTVCGNACKGALVHIAEMLDAEFTLARAQAKVDLKDEAIFLRGSADLTFGAHIQGEKNFQGKGRGATPAPPGGVPKEAAHHQVLEYEPK